jgi:hypothetical protein
MGFSKMSDRVAKDIKGMKLSLCFCNPDVIT